MAFWGELKRRNVVRVAAVYAIVAWLLVQVADTLLPAFEAPDWVLPVFILLLAMGFVVALVLSWAYEVTPEGVKKTAAVEAGDSIAAFTGRKLDFVIIGVMAVAIVYLVVDNYLIDGDTTAVTAGTPASPSRSDPDVPNAGARDVLENSVAVLPLSNLSSDASDAFIADGFHEEIINQLTKLRSLSVINRTTMMQYANNPQPIADIADALRVESIMEGSVQRDGDRISVTTRLIDADTGANLWSETYEEQGFDGILSIRSSIAMEVANALYAEFSPEEQALIERAPTDNALAYNYLLQANTLVGVGDQAPRMHELLDQAIALDPEFAEAYGYKAFLYANELINSALGSASSQAELEPIAREFADRALAIHPEAPNALRALAGLDYLQWNWTEADAALEQVYELTSDSEYNATWFRSWAGEEAQARMIGERQVDLNPLDWSSHFTLGVVLNYAGDYAAAIEALENGIALSPSLSLQHSWLGLTHIALGNSDDGARELALAEQLLGQNRSIVSLLDIAYGYGRIGDEDNARRLFQEIIAAVDSGQDIGTGGMALAQAAIGEYDQTLDWLRRGADRAANHEQDAGFYSLMNLKLNFSNDPILEQPEFVEVRSRLRGD
jgi:TolB-like protein